MPLTRGVSELKFTKMRFGKSTKMADKVANTKMLNKGFNKEMKSFMMTMMSCMLQEETAMNRMESELTLAVQTVIERIIANLMARTSLGSSRSMNTRWQTKGKPEYKWCRISIGSAHLMFEQG